VAMGLGAVVGLRRRRGWEAVATELLIGFVDDSQKFAPVCALAEGTPAACLFALSRRNRSIRPSCLL